MAYKKPYNLRQLQSFLGFNNGYRKYIQNYAKIASPLHDLVASHSKAVSTTNRNRKIVIAWSEEAENAYKSLSDTLTTQPFLLLPNFKKLFVLKTDACDYAVGAILLQEDFNKKLRPVFQQIFNTNSTKIILLAVKHFHHYLFGTTFKIY